MPSPGTRVGVAYGGRSVEHDVSIITALQAMEVLAERHRPVPLYISRSGRWYSDDGLRELEGHPAEGEPEATEVALRIGAGDAPLAALGRRGKATEIELDVVLPAGHGTYLEDGCLPGALELAGLRCAGSPVPAAAVAMDKGLTKAVLREAGLPVLDYVIVHRDEWQRDRGAAIERAAAAFEAPAYVKPVSLGSSIGVSRCTNGDETADALELAFELDRAAIVEPSVEDVVEVNCAALGRARGELRLSVCEQPVKGDEKLLSFDDKYLSGAKGEGKGEGMASADRIIPAPIGDELTERVRELTERAFRAVGCAGVVRVDFLIDGETTYVNELNTIPGSFAFYLWEPAGVGFGELMDALLDVGFAEAEEAARTTRTFASNLLLAKREGAKA